MYNPHKIIYNERYMTNSHKQLQYPYGRFASIRRYTSFDFLKHDPSQIIYIADTTGQFNLWRQRIILRSPEHDGEPYASYQLTNFIDDSVRHNFSSPIDNSLVFFADYQGTENFQIYKISDAFHSWPEPITQNPKVRYEWGEECFSNDGKNITYSSNESNPLNMLVYVYNIDSNQTSCITTGKPGWYIPGYWSPDNKKINCSQLVTLTDYRVWLLDIDNNEMIKVTPDEEEEEKIRYIVGPWSPDGKGFYVVTDLRREYKGLSFYDISKSKLEWIFTPEHDIESVVLSDNGNVLAWTQNVDGYSNIYVKNLQNKEIQELSEISKRKGVIGDLKISPDGKRIGFLMSTPFSPFNIYILDIETERLERLTDAIIGNIPEDKMVQPELIKYNSFDGLEIQAFLYRSNNNDNNGSNNSNKKLGAVLSIHGGPTAQERPMYAYAGFYQYLANNNLAVLAPNFRGSTGYGKGFERKIYHDWGGDELKDLEYATKWLLSQDWIDVNRLAVFGASFGGFDTLSCITRLPHYDWKAAVDIVGPSNLITFVKTVPEHWRRFMAELVGDAEKEEDFLKERSPITYVDNMKLLSLLIIQGTNDPRVVKNESDQIVERLKNKSIDIEYMVFEDEGHGFTKYSNLVKALKRSSEYLVKKLA
jgi:dipeptidyl aminopeptidase/acylaminoacyl peptidase